MERVVSAIQVDKVVGLTARRSTPAALATARVSSCNAANAVKVRMGERGFDAPQDEEKPVDKRISHGRTRITHLEFVQMKTAENTSAVFACFKPDQPWLLMACSACSTRRLPMLTGRRFNFNREDAKGRIKSKVAYHVQIKLI